jgi:hypothetical protein
MAIETLTPAQLATLRDIANAGRRGATIVMGWENPNQVRLRAEGLVEFEAAGANWKITLTIAGERALGLTTSRPL